MKKTVILMLLVLSACSARQTADVYSDKERSRVDSIVRANRNMDSLAVVLERFASEGNRYGEVVAYREIGRSYRNASLFDYALDAHKKGLVIARDICDTMQIVQALNNIGTVYRRMGILDEAASWHYEALTYCGQYSDTLSRTAVKNRVVSLNGIGNVQLTLGNPEMAEVAFRRALAGEASLSSAVGQAINYANIGAILEGRGETDSARIYYSRSLELNKEAGSDLGISLCHAHLGRLYENDGDLEAALREYHTAYDVMLGKSDKWHWLDACVCLSRVYAAKGNLELADKYLATARLEAHKIGSLGHLTDVYRQEYLLFKEKGDYRNALEAYAKSNQYRDSLNNEKNLTHMQNVRVRYEREKKQTELTLMQQEYEQGVRRKNLIIGTIIVTLLFAFIAIAFLMYSLNLRSKNQRIMKELERTRTNFFTNITHEFRTPLTVIRSAADDIHKKSKSDKVICRDAAEILQHSGGLLNLVNQMLEIARMTSGVASSPQWKKTDVVGFISMICERYVRYAAEKDVDLQYVFDMDRLEMEFVPDYMIRIVQNLISNAIKFSNPGSQVLVSVREGEYAAGKTMLMYVCDSGIGMTAGQKENIFKPFYQASSDSCNIGSGIGLSLVKLAVESMDGTVEVHSHPSEGSVFIVSIPVKHTKNVSDVLDFSDYDSFFEVSMVDDAAAPEDEVDGREDTPRILIVEDTPEVARWQMRQLDSEYNFYFASDGDEGFRKAEEVVPDLIITDVMMPVMDGFELCRKIRSSDLLNHIPVIMVTARATADDKVAGLESGADAYLEKPFNPEELSMRVEKLLQQREMLKRKFAEIQDGQEAASAEVSVSDRDFIDRFSSVVHDFIVKGKVDYDELASVFCVGKTQLNRKVKAVTGYTTTEYILQIRISMAKQLLRKTSYPVGDIAVRVGIDDVAYFSSLFRKTTGKTPTAYRNV